MMTSTEKALIETSNKLCADLEAKLKIAIAVLDEISKQTCEVGFYSIPTYEATLAEEALEQIKKGEP